MSLIFHKHTHKHGYMSPSATAYKHESEVKDITISVLELKSGRYKSVTYCSRSEIDPARIEEAKAGVREEWEKIEGVTVESVEFIDYDAPVRPSPKWLYAEHPELTQITENTTAIVVVFHVASPLPIWLIILAVGLVIGFIIGLLVSGTLSKIADFLYKFPEVAVLGIGAVIIIAALLLAPRVIPKREERREGRY